MFDEADIVTTLKSRRISWGGQTWRARDRTILNAKQLIPNGNEPLGRLKQTRVYKVDQSELKMIRVINGKELANDREAWKRVVVAMNGLNGLY